MSLILFYIYLSFALGALSIVAQAAIIICKSLPAMLFTIFSAITITAGSAIFALALPIAMPYAIYQARGK